MADGSGPIVIPAGTVPYDWTPRRKRIVVGFAGGGGSSLAIDDALGVHPDAAINHWPAAIACHERNFPGAAHYCADIFDTDCREVLPGEEIGLAWFSPDCRHHSMAKGGAPVSKRVRGLAWVVIPWAKIRQPDVIMMENVQEWLSWCPLIDSRLLDWRKLWDGSCETRAAQQARDRRFWRALRDGMVPGDWPPDHEPRMVPDPERVGETAQRWFRRLGQCGYVYGVRVSSAADFGDPTIRKRMLVIARRDGLPIVWPAATHAHRSKAAGLGLKAHRSAASILDFSRPCPSIFLSKEEARAMGLKRPHEPATQRRIAKGLYRYTFANADPFIVAVTHQGDDRTYDIREGLRTATTARRGEFALVGANIIRTDMGQSHSSCVHDPEEALRTPTSAGGLGLLAANLIKLSENSIGSEMLDPLHTVMAGAPRHAVVAAHLTQLNTRDVGAALEDPLRTAPAKAHQGLVTAFMEQANTGMVGHDARDGDSTIVSRGTTQRLVTGQLLQLRGTNEGKGEIAEPIGGLTADGQHQGVVTAHLDTYYSAGSVGSDAGEALRTATAKARNSLIVSQLSAVADHGRREQVLTFLRSHFGEPTAAESADPLASPEARSKFGIVLIPDRSGRLADDASAPASSIDGVVVAFIVDVGMRMLDPETELSAAMGWPRSYVLGHDVTGAKVTKTTITKLVGNGVCKAWASSHVAANCADLPWWKDPERMAA